MIQEVHPLRTGFPQSISSPLRKLPGFLKGTKGVYKGSIKELKSWEGSGV